MSETKQIYGLLGYPVEHSASPDMHNCAFEHLGIDAEYGLFSTHPDKLHAEIDRLRSDSSVKGFNVTIPHKKNVMQFLDGIDECAKLMGAVNTVKKDSGRLVGYNTDGYGFARAIKVESGIELGGKSVFIAGAGGAGCAVAKKCSSEGVKQIAVFDIDYERAQVLVDDLKDVLTAVNLSSDKGKMEEYLKNVDIAVNATPIGMKGEDLLPFDIGLLSKKAVVYDLVYNIPVTNLVKQSRARDLKAYTGLSMLLYQGELAFEIWTGKTAPHEIMQTALKRAVYGDCE